jgi:hypothetical protein
MAVGLVYAGFIGSVASIGSDRAEPAAREHVS